jgi:hypothetical protein
MPSTTDESKVFTFSNILALLIVTACFVYFFWISGPSKQSENRDIGEVKTAMISVLTLVIGYYFGSNKSSATKDNRIESLQQTATEVALMAANKDAGIVAGNKIDKLAKIAELKKALEALDPESDEAKAILSELEILEKTSTT